MSYCILTVIKNEHLYLDEWISYHLDMGVSHIFIFEDVGSDSHKDITNKYPNVSLLNILDVFDTDSEKQGVLRYKSNLDVTQSHKPYIQHLYIKKALKYLQIRYDYDWCFVIDVDEYLTLNNSESVDSVLKDFLGYDAVIFWWECYGACGHIKQPDYFKKGVVATYNKPSTGILPNDVIYHSKICYHLSNFNESFYGTPHQPTDLCNWCNTDFLKERRVKTYSRLYIRHYMTKSWEEFLWKKRERGYFCGWSRTTEFFFNFNPELKPFRRELMDEFEQLVVLPYVQSRSQGNELRLALRLWRKYCTFNYHFMVVGEFSDDLKSEFSWVDFVRYSTKKPVFGQYNPHLDMQAKMELAYKLYGYKYLGFIWMVDDNYAIKPFTVEDIKTIHCHSFTFTGDPKAPTWFWNYDKYKTRQLLDREGLPNINYTTHFPCYFEFDRLKSIWDKYNLREESFVVEDIYFNSFDHNYPVLDKTIRLGIWNNDIYHSEFQNAVNNPDIKFVCNSTEGWSKELEQALLEIIGRE